MERRMMRVTRSRKVSADSAAEKQKAEKKIKLLLQRYAENNKTIEKCALSNQSIYEEIEAELKAHSMFGCTDGVYVAEIVDVLTKTSRDIDVNKLRKLLKPEEFAQCIKAQMSEVKKFLVENEINKISKVTPATKTGTKLEINPVKTIVTLKPTRKGRQ